MRGFVGVERIRVLHHEFARAHHAEARPDLVAELGLDLIEIDRQLLVAPDLLARDVGDHLLVTSGCTTKSRSCRSLSRSSSGPYLLPAAGLLPQLGGLDHRHHELERARAVHFLAHDALDLAQRAQAERHPRVDARRPAA